MARGYPYAHAHLAEPGEGRAGRHAGRPFGPGAGVQSMSGPWYTATATAAAVANGKVRAAEVIEATLARIAVVDRKLNTFTDVTAERARKRAAAVDAAVAAGRHPGPLAGVPFAVKNLIDIAGLPTLAGSKINRSHPPA